MGLTRKSVKGFTRKIVKGFTRKTVKKFTRKTVKNTFEGFKIKMFNFYKFFSSF